MLNQSIILFNCIFSFFFIYIDHNDVHDSTGDTADELSSWTTRTGGYSAQILDLLNNSSLHEMVTDEQDGLDFLNFSDNRFHQFQAEGDESDDADEEEEDDAVDGKDGDDLHSSADSESSISDGHWLNVNCALLLVLTFAIAHSITGRQLADLLTLINYFTLRSHPAMRSLYHFRKHFADMQSPIVKHFYCPKCFGSVTSECVVCPNERCKAKCQSKNKPYFIEMSVKNQIVNLFSRDGFYEKLQYRFTRQKSSNANIEDIYDGRIYKKMFDDGLLSNPNNISFTWNTDGIPVFKSSKCSLWPIYLSINELHVKQRMRRENMIFAGLWYGESKPNFLLFTKPLLRDLKMLENEGIDVPVHGKMVRSKAFLLYGCADLPAKSAVMNMNQFNGAFSCFTCLQPGENERTSSGGNIHVFPFNKDDPLGPPREDDKCANDAIEAFGIRKPVHGIKGPSFLLALNSYSFVHGGVIDYMHGVLLGISKVLIKLWFTSKHSAQAFSLYSRVSLVDARLLSIRVTNNISRTPRALSAHFKYWKASEFRSWILFYSLPLLADLMEKTYFFHYACFVEAVHLLSGSSISIEDIERSNQNLMYFVLMFESLYGRRYCGLNMHSLLHLPQTVLDIGPLWAINCFGFEDANGQILKLFHGTQNVDMQIMSAVNTLHLLPQMIQKLPDHIKSLMFVNKNMTRKSCHSKCSIEILGKRYMKELSHALYGLVMLCVGGPPGELSFFNRIRILDTLYHSTSYTRAVKRNSFTVKYLLNGNVQFGHVLFYAENKQNCLCNPENCMCYKPLTYMAFIQRMKPCAQNVATFPGIDNFLNVSIGFVHELSETGITDVVNVRDIRALCVEVYFGETIDDTHFVCEFANMFEFD